MLFRCHDILPLRRQQRRCLRYAGAARSGVGGTHTTTTAAPWRYAAIDAYMRHALLLRARAYNMPALRTVAFFDSASAYGCYAYYAMLPFALRFYY